jgi:hypothetical protein
MRRLLERQGRMLLSLGASADAEDAEMNELPLHEGDPATTGDALAPSG